MSHETARKERAAGARWADTLRREDLHQFVDDLVLDVFDWRDWFERRPSSAFMNGAFDRAQYREEMGERRYELGGALVPTPDLLSSATPTRTARFLEDVIHGLIAWGLPEETARRMLQREINVARFVLAQGGSPDDAANAVMYRAFPNIARERSKFFRARRR